MTDALERAVLDGSLIAGATLSDRDPDGREPTRSPSPSRLNPGGLTRTLSRSPSPSSSSRAPSLSAGSDNDLDDIDPSSPPQQVRHGAQASNTGPKGVLADYRVYKTSAGPLGPTGKGRTGVKGVIGDWKQFTDRDRQRSKGSGAWSNGGRLASALMSKRGGSHSGSGRSDTGTASAEASDVEDELGLGLGDEQDEDLKAYRAKRIAELSGSTVVSVGGGEVVLIQDAGEKDGQKSKRGSPKHPHDRKVFGHLREIGLEQFQSAVEAEDADVAVVLHLYDPHVSACSTINSLLSSLARRLPHTKFLRALASEVDFASGIEADALPTVLVYRGGELETTLVRIDLEMQKEGLGMVNGGVGRERELLDVLKRNGVVDEEDLDGGSAFRKVRASVEDEGSDDGLDLE